MTVSNSWSGTFVIAPKSMYHCTALQMVHS